MIEGGEQHDSLEELFTLQNTEELKVIVRYKVFTFDFGFKSPETWPNRKFFNFLDSRISVRL